MELWTQDYLETALLLAFEDTETDVTVWQVHEMYVNLLDAYYHLAQPEISGAEYYLNRYGTVSPVLGDDGLVYFESLTK